MNRSKRIEEDEGNEKDNERSAGREKEKRKKPSRSGMKTTVTKDGRGE